MTASRDKFPESEFLRECESLRLLENPTEGHAEGIYDVLVA